MSIIKQLRDRQNSVETLRVFAPPGLAQCRDCKVRDEAQRVVPGYGKLDAAVMLIGQSPGESEDYRGTPFVGRSGQFLAECCAVVGWDMDRDLYRTNINKCHPAGNRKTTSTEKAACRKWLDAEFTQIDPDVIVVLGAEALAVFLPDEKASITNIRGNVFKRTIAGRERFIVPTVHPAFAVRNPLAYQDWIVSDLEIAKQLASGRRIEVNEGVIPFRKHAASWEEVMDVATKSPIWGFDIETDTGLDSLSRSLRTAMPIGLSVCDTPGNGLYCPFITDEEAGERMRQIGPYLEDAHVTKIVTNAKFEAHISAQFGTNLQGYEDTLLQAFILGDMPLALKDGVQRAFGIEMIRINTFSAMGYERKDLRTGRYGVDMRAAQDEVPDLVAEYAAQDADASLRLFHHFNDLMIQRKVAHIYHEIEKPFVQSIIEMERNGWTLDPSVLKRPNIEIAMAIATTQAAIQTLTGISGLNVNSVPQVRECLYNGAHPHTIPPRQLRDGKLEYPTDRVGLAWFADNPLVRAILTERALRKLRSAFIVSLPKWIEPDGRVHPEFRQTGAETGRAASANPNIQQIPARKREDVDVPIDGSAIRRAFVAPPGWLICAPDLSQIEMRIVAHLSGDENMIALLTDPDGDIHSYSASQIYGRTADQVSEAEWKQMRYLAKTIGFGVLYGLTAPGLVQRTPTLGLSVHDAGEFIKRFYAGFPALRPWQQSIIEFTRRNGYSETFIGRRRYLPDITAHDRQFRTEAERAAINHPVQGSAADFFKKAILDVHRIIDAHDLRTRLIAQVHDELVLEAPEDEIPFLALHVPEAMGGAFALSVPVPVDFEFGPNWADLHKP
jgi:DNA polymerase-1